MLKPRLHCIPQSTLSKIDRGAKGSIRTQSGKSRWLVKKAKQICHGYFLILVRIERKFLHTYPNRFVLFFSTFRLSDVAHFEGNDCSIVFVLCTFSTRKGPQHRRPKQRMNDYVSAAVDVNEPISTLWKGKLRMSFTPDNH